MKVTADPIARFSLKSVKDLSPVEADRQVLMKVNALIGQLKLTEADIFQSVAMKISSESSKARNETDDDRSARVKHDAKEDEDEDRRRQERRDNERLVAFQEVLSFKHRYNNYNIRENEDGKCTK